MKIEGKAEEIKISVRNLVEFILRSGDIDNRMGSGRELEAMQLGSKIHRKIQKKMGAEYEAEVPLKITKEFDEFQVVIEGRADGVIHKDGQVIVDEIKGVFLELDFLEEPVEVHLAQGKCYAYIYACKEQLAAIDVQLTYCNMESEAIKRFSSSYTFAELEEWFFGVLEEYKKWADFQFQWRRKRNVSVKKIDFPFSYRAGQKDLAASVYRTMLRKKRLFIQASTGVGKTMAALFPTVKAVGEQLGEKIFYLTAKTITRTVAEDAFSLLKEQGLQFKVVTITAKEKSCICEEMECNPVHCPYAKGHYDRVNDAVYELLTTAHTFSREVIAEHGRKHQVCPFEMCLDISTWSDAVICDYNYVFDPNAHLRRFFGEGVKGEYLFLIDEAHNLVERSREMYSASLYKESFLELKKMLKTVSKKVTKHLEQCNKDLLELKRECDTYMLYEGIPHFSMHLLQLYCVIETFLEECEQEEVRKQVLEFYFQVRHFLYILERVDDNYVIYTELENSGKFKIKLFCVDTAKSLREYLNKGNSTVFFSATLLPIHYYKGLLGDVEEDYAVYAESTFPDENRMVLLGNDVSSKYSRRGKWEYEKMASYIGKTVQAKKGNYMVFFPSYKLMNEVYEAFLESYEEDSWECICQTAGMQEADREEFLNLFTTERKKSLVAFCVMGGIFSEGIDLTHDKLIGVLIMGTGLPQVCNEREILKQYYDERDLNGFSYAYLYAGMNKVLQSAGRVIRTADDKGIVLLLDERFYSDQYRQLFPREWKQFYLCNLNNISAYLASFWETEK